MQIHILGVALLAVILTSAQAGEYLTEKPNVLVPCSLDDLNISNCLAKNLQDIFINWADGIPGKDVFGLTDPFNLDNYIETKEISGFDGRPITIHNEFLNFSVKGLSKGIISAASYGDGIATASLDIPKLILNFDFKATIEDGKNISKIDDKVEMNLIGVTIDFSANLQRRETPKATFLDFSKVENHMQASDIQILSEADPDKSFNRYISDPENDFSGVFKAWDRNWVDPLLLKRPLIWYPAPKFNKCLVKNLQTIFINWKDGIPGSDIVGPIDPFTINFDFWTKLFGSELSSLGIEINFTDIVVKGMSQAVITEASYVPSKYEAKVAFNIPKLSFYFEYSVKGNGSTNNVQLYSKDDGTIELSDLLLEYEMTLKPRVAPEGTFFDVEHLKGDFKDVGDAKNDLDESIVERETSLIDIDWRELYRSFQEFYDSPHESLLLDRVKKILSYIPATYIIDNIH